MLLVFDMDGVLIDSKVAVRMSYSAAGIRMPDEAWGKPWFEWLGDEAIHTKKVELYPEYLKKYGRQLPLVELARVSESALLTAASHEAVEAFLDLTGLRGGMKVLGYSCTRGLKATMLKNLLADRKDVLYFDDDAAEARALKSMSGVPCIGVSFPGMF